MTRPAVASRRTGFEEPVAVLIGLHNGGNVPFRRSRAGYSQVQSLADRPP